MKTLPMLICLLVFLYSCNNTKDSELQKLKEENQRWKNDYEKLYSGFYELQDKFVEFTLHAEGIFISNDSVFMIAKENDIYKFSMLKSIQTEVPFYLFTESKEKEFYQITRIDTVKLFQMPVFKTNYALDRVFIAPLSTNNENNAVDTTMVLDQVKMNS